MQVLSDLGVDAWAVLDPSMSNRKLRALMSWMFLLGVATALFITTGTQYLLNDGYLWMPVTNAVTWVLALCGAVLRYRGLRFKTGRDATKKG